MLGISKKVKQICDTHKFIINEEKKFAYGEINGYLFTISEKGGIGKFYINCAFGNKDFEEKLKSIKEFLERKTKSYPKPTYRFDKFGVEVNLYENYKFVKSAENFISEFTDFLKSTGVDGINRCCLCGEPLVNRTVKRIYRNGRVMICDSACADKAVRGVKENTEAIKNINKNYGRGTLGAVIFSILGSIPWIIVYLLGYFVGWLGAVIAFCARKGYEIFGGREGRMKAVIVILVTLLGVVFAQFAGVCIELSNIFADEGMKLSLSQTISITIQCLQEDEDVFRYFVADLAMGFLFAAFGLWRIIRSIINERKEITAKIIILD